MAFFGFKNPYCECRGHHTLCPSCSRLAALVAAHGIEPFPPPLSSPGVQEDDGQDLIEITPIYEHDAADGDPNNPTPHSDEPDGMSTRTDGPGPDADVPITESRGHKEASASENAPAIPTPCSTQRADMSGINGVRDLQKYPGEHSELSTDTGTESEGDLDFHGGDSSVLHGW